MHSNACLYTVLVDGWMGGGGRRGLMRKYANLRTVANVYSRN